MTVHAFRHSFPTRRSSDLPEGFLLRFPGGSNDDGGFMRRLAVVTLVVLAANALPRAAEAQTPVPRALERSEEHTSELQSLTNLVCRLLLETKKRRIDPVGDYLVGASCVVVDDRACISTLFPYTTLFRSA